MTEKDTSAKIPFTNLVDRDKLTQAILSTFSAEELNTATQNKVFSWSDNFVDFVAQSDKNPLGEIARKVRFVKLLAEVQLHENLDAQGKKLFFDVDFEK